MTLFFHDGIDGPGLSNQAGHFAEEIALAEDIDGYFPGAAFLEKPDLPGLDDVHSGAGLAFLKEDRSGRESPPELIKEALLFFHRPSLISS
jgi:hypothetical protein